MASHYTITVKNESGISGNYVITQEAPPIEGLAAGAWPLVISRARVPQGATATFSIDIPNPYYAYAISTQGKPGIGSSVDVSTKIPVTLGKKESGGRDEPGSSVQYVVVDEAPSLQDTASRNGYAGSFEIKTGSDFTDGDAKNGHYLIGYGSKERAWAAFTPQPNTSYQIQPSKVFYLIYSELTTGQLVDVQTVGRPLKLDFSVLSREVRVTQTETGELVIDE